MVMVRVMARVGVTVRVWVGVRVRVERRARSLPISRSAARGIHKIHTVEGGIHTILTVEGGIHKVHIVERLTQEGFERPAVRIGVAPTGGRYTGAVT